MTNEELLESLNTRFDAIGKRFDSIDKRLDAMQSDIESLKDDVADLKESAEITRGGVNSLLEWAEECGNVIKFPLPKVK